jgi:hypothetical protein
MNVSIQSRLRLQPALWDHVLTKQGAYRLAFVRKSYPQPTESCKTIKDCKKPSLPGIPRKYGIAYRILVRAKMQEHMLSLKPHIQNGTCPANSAWAQPHPSAFLPKAPVRATPQHPRKFNNQPPPSPIHPANTLCFFQPIPHNLSRPQDILEMLSEAWARVPRYCAAPGRERAWWWPIRGEKRHIPPQI